MPNKYKVTLSTESPNDKSMIVVTKGIDYTDYQKNPVLLYMHKRGAVIGNVVDIAVEQDSEGKDKLVGYLVFGDTKECREYETLFSTGVLRAVSIGITLVETYKTNGYTFAMKSTLRETSVVDMPSNSECLKEEQFATEENFVALFTSLTPSTQTENSMKKILIALGLSETDNEDVALKALDKLNQELNTLKAGTGGGVDVAKLQADLKTATDNLKAKTEELVKLQAESLVNVALAANKILPHEKEQFIKLASVDFKTTKEVIEARLPYVPLTTQIQQANLAALAGGGKQKTWDDYHKNNPQELEKLKNTNKDLYIQLYKEKFGVEPKY